MQSHHFSDFLNSTANLFLNIQRKQFVWLILSGQSRRITKSKLKAQKPRSPQKIFCLLQRLKLWRKQLVTRCCTSQKSQVGRRSQKVTKKKKWLKIAQKETQAPRINAITCQWYRIYGLPSHPHPLRTNKTCQNSGKTQLSKSSTKG